MSLVLTYSKCLPDVYKILRRHMSILHDSERMQEVFRDEPMAAYRRDSNLSDILVHGKLSRECPARDQPVEQTAEFVSYRPDKTPCVQ